MQPARVLSLLNVLRMICAVRLRSLLLDCSTFYLSFPSFATSSHAHCCVILFVIIIYHLFQNILFSHSSPSCLIMPHFFASSSFSSPVSISILIHKHPVQPRLLFCIPIIMCTQQRAQDFEASPCYLYHFSSTPPLALLSSPILLGPLPLDQS